ncbi:MAG TPA: FtsX-like permease family protein, partial [Gammaproteobacteria bacterium]|nr:FtsX-like permease family protein [Gammaproteobacteria bacterium]
HLGHTSNARLPFDFLASMDLLESVRVVTMDPEALKFMAGRWLGTDGITYMRFPERGLSAAALRAQLQDFAARHVPAQALRDASYEFGLTPVDELVSLGLRNFQGTGLSFGTVLFALASLVLGVACLNYANLATARAARRARETGVRKALGAGPRQVAAQSMVETGLLTSTALVVAVSVFSLSGPVLDDLLGVDLAPTLFTGFGVWLFLAAVVAGVSFAAGFYPAVVLARVRPTSAIAGPDVRMGSKLFSTVLAGTQFAAASALLLAVLIVAVQNAAVRRAGLGLTEDPLLVIENPRRVTKVEPATLRTQLERLPQVRGVTEYSAVPWEMTMIGRVRASPEPTSPARPVILRTVGEDFFDVFDIP